MKNIVKNKKTLVLGILLFILLLATIIPNVYGVPPNRPLKDFDWNHWQNKPHMFSEVPGNVGVGTPNPEEKLTLGALYNFAIEMKPPLNVEATGAIGGTLTDGTYWFRIAASDGVGTTVRSEEVSCYVDGSSENMIILTWDPVEGADHYLVYKGSAEGEENKYTICPTNSYEYTSEVGWPSGEPPKVTTAYINKISSNDDSWFLAGDIGIGTSTPQTELDVKGVIQASSLSGFGKFQIKRTDLPQSWSQKIRADGAFELYDETFEKSAIVIESNSEDNIIYIDNQGEVGIGKIPDVELDVSGDIQVNGDYKYSAVKTCYLNIPAIAFQQDKGITDDSWDCHFDGYGYIIDGSTPYEVGIGAPVFLPNGADVTDVTIYYVDDESSNDLEIGFCLYRREITDIDTDTLACISHVTSGDSSSIQEISDTTISNSIVNNEEYQYHVYCLWDQNGYLGGNNMIFCGCRIEYTMDKINP